jgi:hypothetical protein
MKSENLNFLKPSGPLQACNGTALPFFVLDLYAEYLMMAELNAQNMWEKREIVIFCESYVQVVGFLIEQRV